ncbi:MAG: signal peptidase II [Caulobacteraceae bacterium]
MKLVTRWGVLAYVLALTSLTADQASKRYLVEVFELGQKGRVEFFGPIHLNLLWNRGVSFGILGTVSWGPWVISGFSLLIACILAVWARNAQRPFLAAALGLIMGGAIGNLVDRVRLGAVIDFIDAKDLFFQWIFNIADASITVGVGLLILDMLLQPSGETATNSPPSPAKDAG